MVHSPNINNGFGSSYELVADGNTYSPDFVMNDNEIHAVWRDGTTNTVKYRRGWVSAAGMNEIQSSSAELIKIVDLTGRECEYSPDKPLLFIYSDGTVSRKMIVGE